MKIFIKHKLKTTIFAASTALLLSSLSSQLVAEPALRQVQGVSYSDDHWPKRWSSAIHQQQDARFPDRQKTKLTVQHREESISARDLFYLPSTGNPYGFNYSRGQVDERLRRNRYLRDAHRASREAAYAYQRMQPMQFSGRFGPVYGGFNMNSGLVGMDPVVAMPGSGMPFPPYGYPPSGFQGGGYWGPSHW